MPTEVEVTRHRETRLTDEDAIDEHRVDPIIHLIELAA